MILCIEIIISYIILYDMIALDIVIRYHGLKIALACKIFTLTSNQIIACQHPSNIIRNIVSHNNKI
jgi:hypothetical protein